MSNEELQAQFARCQAWNDPEQWAMLAMLYFVSGYYLNAAHCLKRAEACRGVAVETETTHAINL